MERVEIIKYLESEYDVIFREYAMTSENCRTFESKSAKESLMRKILSELRSWK